MPRMRETDSKHESAVSWVLHADPSAKSAVASEVALSVRRIDNLPDRALFYLSWQEGKGEGELRGLRRAVYSIQVAVFEVQS